MIEPRTHRAPVSMGNMAPLLGAAYAAPSTRHCPRCGCRLSRYAAAADTYCAPCSSVLHPYHPPEPRPTHELTRRGMLYRSYKSTTCSCGQPKTSGARRCLACHLAANQNPWRGKTCHICGGPKAPGARMCFHCRYHTEAIT